VGLGKEQAWDEDEGHGSVHGGLPGERCTALSLPHCTPKTTHGFTAQHTLVLGLGLVRVAVPSHTCATPCDSPLQSSCPGTRGIEPKVALR